MGKTRMEKLEDIKNAFRLIPSYQQGSSKSFRPPPTIESDFKRYLQHDVPHINHTFELIHDWFAPLEEGYEPIFIRAQQTPIDWKSKIGNSDMATNFKVTHEVDLHKGDMVVREDGTIYLLNWNVQNHANNQATQSVECNVMSSFERRVPAEVDANGYLVREAHKEVVVPEIPFTHIEYAGRPDYAATQGIPGINPDQLITCTMQWNSHTRNIEINDEFTIGMFTYRVVNISLVEVRLDRKYGVLTLNARRIAGGGIEDGE